MLTCHYGAHRSAVLRDRRSRRGGRGQATVEFALTIPILILALMLVFQMVLVARDQLLVVHAAREGARAAAVDPTSSTARDGARRSSGALRSDRIDTSTARANGRVTVTVRYRSVTDLPLIGRLVPDPMLSSSVTMAEEK
jgi:Flp pilus assembly protein TadG